MKKRTRRFSLVSPVAELDLESATGGRKIYKIGDKVVSKDEYKDSYQEAKASASQY